MTVLVDRFPGWVESVELLPASPRFDALRQAAETIGGTLDADGALELVAYAVGRGSTATFQAVCLAVAANDPDFTASSSDLEPRLVASAAIARALENDDLTASVAAAAVLSAEFAGLFSPVGELPELARAAQARLFRGLREPVSMPRLDLEGPLRNLPSFAAEGWSPAQALDGLVGASRAIAQRVEAVLAAMTDRFETRLDAADEELEVLWWAFSARGTRAAEDWREPSSVNELLQVGLELADRHRTSVEIPSSLEILRRVLGPRGEEYHVLSDVVAAAAGTVELDSAQPGPLFTILTSMMTCVTLQDETDWIAAATRLGVDPAMTRRGDEIAAQTVRELLLGRAIAE